MSLSLIAPAFAEGVDYKDCFTSEITIKKDEEKNEFIVADTKLKQSFLLTACEETMYVSAKEGLNVRSVPTTKSSPIKALPYGEEVFVIGSQKEEDNMWVLIEYNDNYAFVWSEYLTEEKPEVKVNTSSNSSSSSSKSDLTYLGNWMCTAYEWTGSPCANGNYPTEGYTVACNSLPFGTRIYIDGWGYYVVEDRGGGGDHWVDIYMGDESTCNNFGVRYLDVYIVN